MKTRIALCVISLLLSGNLIAQIEMRPRPTDEKDFPAYI